MNEYNEKYSKGLIYTIICLETGEFYIGSSINYNARKQHHRGLTLKSTTPLMERESYMFEIIERYPCNSKKELHERENYYITLYKDCINKRLAILDKQSNEYKQRKAKWDRDYRLKHKDKLKLKYKERYIPHPRTKLTEEQKQENRRLSILKIREKQFQRFECPCGGSYIHKHKQTHFRTKKHLNFKQDEIN